MVLLFMLLCIGFLALGSQRIYATKSGGIPMFCGFAAGMLFVIIVVLGATNAITNAIQHEKELNAERSSFLKLPEWFPVSPQEYVLVPAFDVFEVSPNCMRFTYRDTEFTILFERRQAEDPRKLEEVLGQMQQTILDWRTLKPADAPRVNWSNVMNSVPYPYATAFGNFYSRCDSCGQQLEDVLYTYESDLCVVELPEYYVAYHFFCGPELNPEPRRDRINRLKDYLESIMHPVPSNERLFKMGVGLLPSGK
jgi:hypothetical protein